jgi:hypothetical protein
MPTRLQWWRDRSRDPRVMLVLGALTLIMLATALALHVYIIVKAVSSSSAASACRWFIEGKRRMVVKGGEKHIVRSRYRKDSSSLWRPHAAKSLRRGSDRSGDSCSAGCRREHLLFSAINDHSGLKKQGRHT